MHTGVTHTQTHTHTHTQHKHKHTQTHTSTNTHTNTHTHKYTNAHSYFSYSILGTIFPLILFTGPRTPTAPKIGEITPSPHSVVIRWTVSSVSYTPETYTVHYGIDSAILNLTSDTLATNVKTDFLNIKDQDYRLVIDGLQPAQKHHYYVVSANSYASSKTAKHNFTTADSGKKTCLCSSSLIFPLYMAQEPM